MWAMDSLNIIARKNFNLAREMLEKIICAYAKYIKDDVFLVLDGYKGTCPYTQRVSMEGIEVVVTGKGINADMWIMDTIAIKGFSGSVVTSDRQIIRSAERKNIPVITSGRFEKTVMKTIGYEFKLLDELAELKWKYKPTRRLRREDW